MRRFNRFALLRILVGAPQNEVRWAVDRWAQKDKSTTSFDMFIFALRVTHNVVKLIPWVRKVSTVLYFFLDLMDVLIEIYTFTYPQLPAPQLPDKILLSDLDRKRIIQTSQAILDDLVAK